MSSVVLRNIKKRYGNHLALDNVSLSIVDGEFLSLLGPSGSGKTTLLRVIAGFVAADEGQIEIGGVDVSSLPPHKRNLGMVFQNYALFPHLTVVENIQFGLKRRGVARQEAASRALEAIEMVGLSGLQDRYPSQLSGGQQQRVALARATVIKPNVLLLDEPLGALDLKLRRRMQLELKELQSRLGITLIYVTHDQDEALAMSDRIAVMRDARVLQVDPPKDLYERPKTAFVADFLGEANLLSALVVSIDQEQVRLELNGGDLVHVTTDALVEPGHKVTLSIRPERISLREARQQGQNAFPVAVQGVVYHGHSSSVMVTLPGGTTLRLAQVNSEHREAKEFVRANGYYVQWDTCSARILASDIDVK